MANSFLMDNPDKQGAARISWPVDGPPQVKPALNKQRSTRHQLVRSQQREVRPVVGTTPQAAGPISINTSVRLTSAKAVETATLAVTSSSATW